MNTYIVNGKPYEVSLDQEEQFLKDVEEQGFTATLQQPMEVDQPQINQQQEKPLINLLKTSLKLTPLKPLVDIAEIPVVKNKMLRAGEGAISMVDNFIKGYETGELPFVDALIDDALGGSYSIAKTGAEVLREKGCLLYTSPSPRDRQKSRMPSSA